MHTNNKCSFIVFLGLCFTLLFLPGCAGKIPQQTIDNSSALSISIGLDSLGSFLNKEHIKMEEVYFVKLDNENDSLEKDVVFPSNYNKEPLMASFQMDNIDSFCFDLEPGIYAAVGARGRGPNTKIEYYVFFPKDMIRQTIVNLEKNSFRYLGEFDLEGVSFTRQMDSPDEIQLYYFMSGVIDKVPGPNKPQTIFRYQSPQYHSPILKKAHSEKNDEIQFLNNILSSFKKSAWKNNIMRRLGELSH